MATPDLTPGIQQTASGPAAASSDAGSVTAMPIAAQIQAQQFLASASAAKKKRRGLRFSKIIPAGPVSDQQGTGFGGLGGFAGGSGWF